MAHYSPSSNYNFNITNKGDGKEGTPFSVNAEKCVCFGFLARFFFLGLLAHHSIRVLLHFGAGQLPDFFATTVIPAAIRAKVRWQAFAKPPIFGHWQFNPLVVRARGQDRVVHVTRQGRLRDPQQRLGVIVVVVVAAAVELAFALLGFLLLASLFRGAPHQGGFFRFRRFHPLQKPHQRSFRVFQSARHGLVGQFAAAVISLALTYKRQIRRRNTVRHHNTHTKMDTLSIHGKIARSLRSVTIPFHCI